MAKIYDDGLILPEVRWHSLKKYKLIKYYAEQFSTAMKNGWDCRVYIDLYAGAGFAKVEGNKEIIPTSSFLALDVKFPFDMYIFCEIDSEKAKALDFRVKQNYPDRNVLIIPDDTNEKTSDIMHQIPQFSKDYKVISFCVVDIFAISNLIFSTIKTLGNLRMDFLVLIPSGMELNRWKHEFLKASDKRIANFLGIENWRQEWKSVEETGIDFSDFIMNAFNRQMVKLGYLDESIKNSVKILHPEKHFVLYHLLFYSKHPLGIKFWKNCKIGTEPQLDLFNN